MSALSRSNDRVICLIDMDCFYVQVEEIAAPEFRGKPCGVSQYNPYKGGGLIAVNYEARKFGVKRGMRGEEAKKLCPDFHTFYVKEKRGKADLTKYREASLKIFEIILKHCQNVEKASIDEAYIDLTDLVMEKIRNKSVESVHLIDSYVVGTYNLEHENDEKQNLKSWLDLNPDLSKECSDVCLIIGSNIVQDIRHDIENTLGYHCSAGIAQNKTLSKLCCGINKPNKQTILPFNSVQGLLETIPINKIKNLGGKLGGILIEQFGLKTVGDLSRQNLNDLLKNFGDKTGTWLHQIGHGIDLEPVMSRQAAKSIGCSKNFRGKQVLNTVTKVEHWVRQLCEELEERLEGDKKMNQREASLLVIHITNEAGTFSKSTGLSNTITFSANYFVSQSMESLHGFNKSKLRDQWYPAIYTLGISASKFIEQEKNGSSNLHKYFSSNKKKYETEMEPCSSANLNQEQAIVDAEGDENEDKLYESNSADNTVSHISSEDLRNEAENDSEILSKAIVQEEQIADSESSEPIKTSNKNDIRSLLKMQKEKAKMFDESDNDADIMSDSDDLVVLDQIEPRKDLREKKSVTGTEKIDDFIKKSFNRKEDDMLNSNLEDIDYVLCTQCNKKILCWNMPEHEDFHFAQMISRQQAAENSSVNTKKRLAEDTPGKLDKKETKSQKDQPKSSKTSKKLKTDTTSTSQKASVNVKPINNYFKKSNN